jgi:hypothetical protein
VDLFISTEKIMVLNTDLKVHGGFYFGISNELQTLLLVQLMLKKRSLSYGARIFIIMFTEARHAIA